jgi:hypothetical protein
MPLVQTRGAASAQGFGEFAQASAPVYIEDVFSTYLYTGTGASRTITNDIDLSTKGGLVWIKTRSAGENHSLTDTVRTADFQLASSTTGAQTNEFNRLTAFTTSGFSLSTSSLVNANAATYVGWTFRKQPKFFDVVTYTGNGTNGRAISHSLNSVPGCIMVKSTSNATDWIVYHRGLSVPTNRAIFLNTTAAESTSPYFPTTPTSTVFYTNGDGYEVNTTGQTYVAYLFAHDAGGFGLTGTDNVISCGSFNYNTDPQTVTIGYEPQWLMVKQTDGTGDWIMFDNMRGFTANAGGGIGKRLLANTSGAETNNDGLYYGGATGFNLNLPSYGTYIYIAIRRGPMKVPTVGTSVFSPNYQTASTGTAITTNFPPDLQLYRSTAQVANEGVAVDRLRGVNSTTTANSTPWLDTTTAADEATASSVTRSWDNTGFQMPSFVATVPSVFYSFRRAPSFFDEVCYTGTGSNTTQTHNLGVAPELWIVKGRNAGSETWNVGSTAFAATERIILASTAAKDTVPTMWNSTYPTSTVFSIGTAGGSNTNTKLYVAYLFATCAGVSKVGSYTGTGTTQTINCGFTAGARFVLIKKTSGTGSWYVWDSARGIVSGNDPYLLLNSTAAEVTNTDYIDTYSAGFEISSTAPSEINENGGSFIFLAIS